MKFLRQPDDENIIRAIVGHKEVVATKYFEKQDVLYIIVYEGLGKYTLWKFYYLGIHLECEDQFTACSADEAFRYLIEFLQ